MLSSFRSAQPCTPSMHCAGFTVTVNEPGKISEKLAKETQPQIFPFPNKKIDL